MRDSHAGTRDVIRKTCVKRVLNSLALRMLIVLPLDGGLSVVAYPTPVRFSRTGDFFVLRSPFVWGVHPIPMGTFRGHFGPA